jgi:protein-disulfide isomerase
MLLIALFWMLLLSVGYFQLYALLSEKTDTPVFSDSDLVAIVDARLEFAAKEQRKASLERIESSWGLAQESVEDGRLLYGDLGARFTLEEYGDIECPYCRKMHANLKQVVDASEGVINWQFKHFPLSRHNPVAAIESQAVECISSEYGNRTAWAILESMMTDTAGNGRGVGDIPEYIRSVGLNGIRIENCMRSDHHKAVINEHYGDGMAIGITATPAVRVVDNTTRSSILVKGYRSPDQLLEAIASFSNL